MRACCNTARWKKIFHIKIPITIAEVTLRTFALEKIDLPRENLPEYTRGKFIFGFILPRWKGHTEEDHI